MNNVFESRMLLDEEEWRHTLVGSCVEPDGEKTHSEGQQTPNSLPGGGSEQDLLEIHASLIDHPAHNLLQLIICRIARRLSSEQRPIHARAFDPSGVEKRPPSVNTGRLGRGIVGRSR